MIELVLAVVGEDVDAFTLKGFVDAVLVDEAAVEVFFSFALSATHVVNSDGNH